MHCLFKKGASKQNETSSAIRKKVGLFDMSHPRASGGMVFKAGISLVIRDHLGVPWCDVAFCLLGCCIVCPVVVLLDGVSRE